MGSNHLVVGEDHLVGQSCQQYNCQTGWRGLIAIGSSPRRGKTHLKPLLSCGSIALWKRLQEITSRKNQEWSKGGLILNHNISLTASLGGRENPTDRTHVVSTHRRVLKNWVSSKMLQSSIELVVTNSSVPSYF